MIPGGRRTVLAASWVFCGASALLLLEFVTLRCGAYVGSYYTGSPASWATSRHANLFGGASCVLWVVGFVLIVDWVTPQSSRAALAAAVCKLIASVLFNVQPWSALVVGSTESYLVRGVGVPWSNFVGICFFHAGNCADFVRLVTTTPRGLPLAGMTAYVLATTCLCVGDGIEYFALDGIYAPPAHPHISRARLKWIAPLQITGSALLLLGSLLFVLWASPPRRNKHPYGSPLLDDADSV